MKDNLNSEVAVWQHKLIDVFYKIQGRLEEDYSINLKTPNFEISPEINNTLGEWNPERRLIRIALKLFYTQPFSVIEETLRHEVAHQIVTEIFHEDKPGVSHGEAFSKACALLGIDDERTLNENEWLTSSNLDPVVEKIRKIVDKAHCEAASEKEAEIFLQKAQELMVKYNLKQCQLEAKERIFVTRPVSKLYKKMPNYLFALTRLLNDHYFVKSIKSYVSVTSPETFEEGMKYEYYMELFGEPSNVEIAGYIFNVILHQSDNLWEKFKKERKRLKRPIRGMYTKGSYIRGVIAGYEDKLNTQKEYLASKNTEYHALIHVEDPLLKEMYQQEYPRIRRTSSKHRKDSGFDHGFQEGQNLTISTPLGKSVSRGMLIGL